MVRRINPKRLDVAAFAKAGARCEANELAIHFPRLAAEAFGLSDAPVHWSAEGELRIGAGGAQSWLHVQAQAALSMQCQNCLEAVAAAVSVDRWFRFAIDDASAEREDEDSEEDVLALNERFDLHSLVEDELLMALPMVPRHVGCAIEPNVVAVAEGLEPSAHPFAGLAALKH